MLPADVLQVVLLLLQLEDMSDEELLQVLVGKVDAQLFEATKQKKKKCVSRAVAETTDTDTVPEHTTELPVNTEVLKSKDVQQTDGSRRDGSVTGRWPVYGCVDFIHDPDEESAVDSLHRR